MNVLGYLLICLSTFTKTPQSAEIGQLAFFDSACGECWEEVTDNIGGRVLVIAGEYTGSAEDGRTETHTYIVNEVGGEIWHRLTVDEMASHHHDLFVNTDSGSAGNVAPYSSAGSYTFKNVDDIIAVGGNKEHSNMQPFVVKPLCKKVCELEYVAKADFDALKNEFDAIRAFVNLTITAPPAYDPNNKDPTVIGSIHTIYATVGKEFSWTIPDTVFVDADEDTLDFSATLSNGKTLPSFMEFVPGTRKFLGVPKEEDVGEYRIRVVVTDGRGGEVNDVFYLLVNNLFSTTSWPKGKEDDIEATGISFGMLGGVVMITACCILILLFVKARDKECCKNFREHDKQEFYENNAVFFSNKKTFDIENPQTKKRKNRTIKTKRQKKKEKEEEEMKEVEK
ncbi:MAG: putative Ig domain-containing protein [Bacteroidota bacterium]